MNTAQEYALGRVVKLDNIGTQRSRMAKAIVLALNELVGETFPSKKACDILAFVTLSLDAISKTIDQSVLAWEKRGYWVKADRFRLEWLWARQSAENLRTALLNDDWDGAENIAGQVRQKLNNVKVSPHHRLGKPWVGAWEKLR